MVLTYLLYISPLTSNSAVHVLAAILVSVLSSKGHIYTGWFKEMKLWLLINNRKLWANGKSPVCCKKMCFIIIFWQNLILVFINDTYSKKTHAFWWLLKIRRKTQLRSFPHMTYCTSRYLMSWAAVFLSSSWPGILMKPHVRYICYLNCPINNVPVVDAWIIGDFQVQNSYPEPF